MTSPKIDLNGSPKDLKLTYHKGTCYSDGFAPRGQTPSSNGNLVFSLWLTVPEIIAISFLGQQILKKVNFSEPCWWSHFFHKFVFIFNWPFLNALTYKNGTSTISYTFSSSFGISCSFWAAAPEGTRGDKVL